MHSVYYQFAPPSVNMYSLLCRKTKHLRKQRNVAISSSRIVYRSFSKSFCTNTNQANSNQKTSLDATSLRYTDSVSQRKYMDEISTKINIKDMTDWYKITKQDLINHGATDILMQYQNSPFHLLESVYPEYDWMPWKFATRPRNYWDNISNQRRFMDWVGKELKIKEMSDWYNKDINDICQVNFLKEKYDSSMAQALPSIYPEYNWLPWLFSKSPNNIWESQENVTKYFDWISNQLNITNLSDWYKVQLKDITNIDGGLLIKNRFNGSLYKALSEVYPDYDWLPWRFNGCPRNYWDDLKNRKKFMDWARDELKIKEMSDWYKVTVKDISNLGGKNLLSKYEWSPSQLISGVYPEFEWLPWRFVHCPHHYWNDMQNQRKFMNWAAQEFNIKEMDDWYKVTPNDYESIGGLGLLKSRYNFSPIQLLSSMFPEYNWLPWKFNRSPRNYWENLNNKRNLIIRIGKKLKIKEMNDWYNVSQKEIIEHGGGILLLQYPSLAVLLSQLFPDFEWTASRFSQENIWKDVSIATFYVDWLKKQSDLDQIEYINKFIESLGNPEDSLVQLLSQSFPQYYWGTKTVYYKKSQYKLKECLQTLFPNQEALEDYRHPDLVSSDKPLELDFFYPEYNLAVEYQGLQHYREVGHYHSIRSLEDNKYSDQYKYELCKEKGISIIKIPYWWNKKYDSFAATVYTHRPDLFKFKPTGTPIPATPPTNKQKLNEKSQKILMTATEWDESSMDPTGWYMTEKFDGMRLFWNGSKFLTRQGDPIKVPDSIIKGMPSSVSLDGELWTQYGLYQEAVTLTKTTSEEKWKKAIFWVFDAPEIDKPLEERIEFLKQQKFSAFVQIVDFVKCTGKSHLKEYFERILSKGGEGLMLREPNSMYKAGRSSSLRKFKPFYDTEVRVVENKYPHGFMCEQLNGRQLFVSLKDNFEDAKKVKKGSVITVKHSGVNVYETLQFPQFYRERLDLKWDDLIKAQS